MIANLSPTPLQNLPCAELSMLQNLSEPCPEQRLPNFTRTLPLSEPAQDPRTFPKVGPNSA